MPDAESILDALSVDRAAPTLQQLSLLNAKEWIVVLDAIIDRTLAADRRNSLEQLLDPLIVSHRWIERQLQSVERLAPLLPWFIT